MKQLAPPPIFQFFDDNGVPLAGGKLYSYGAGGTTPLATYTDAGGGTPNTNPIILDANGECVVWMGAAAYKFVLKDSSDVVQWTRDNVQFIPDGSIVTIMLADGSVTVDKMDLSDLEPGDLPDDCIDTQNILDGAITAPKIPDGEIPITKLAASSEIVFVQTADPRDGDGPTAFPVKPWTAPVLIPTADTPPVGDGLAVKWSPNGKTLLVAENNTDFAGLYSRSGTELVKLIPGITLPPSAIGLTAEWSPDGRYIIIAGSFGTAVFQKQGNTYAHIATPTNAITTATQARFSPNGRYIAVSHTAANYISVIKLSDVTPNHITAVYTSNAGGTVGGAGGILNFEDKETDNLDSVTIGAGWNFLAKRTSEYHIKAFAEFDLSGGGFGITAKLELILYRNGAAWKQLDTRAIYTAGIAVNTGLGGSATVYLASGETIQIQISTNVAVKPLAADGTKVYCSIVEAPGFDSLSKFSLLSDPATLPTGAAQSVGWSPDGMFLAVGHAISPFVTIYQRSGDVFVKCADPAALPAGQVNGLSWSPDGLKLTCVHATTPFITTYTRPDVGSVTFTKVPANPTTLPAAAGNACAYNSLGTKLAVAHDSSPFVTIYSVSGSGSSSVFAKDTDPANLPTGNGKSVDWTPDSQLLSVGHVSSPYVSNYKTTGAAGSSAVLWMREDDLV